MTLIAPLSDVLEAFETGKRPTGGAVESGIPSLGGEHISSKGTLKLENIKYVPEQFFQKMAKGKLCLNDILIVKDGATTGRVGMIESSFPFSRASINEHLFLLRADIQRVNPSFLYFYLRSRKGQEQIMSDFRGAAQGGISREIKNKVRLPLPVLSEQQNIADILSRAEGIIRLRREAQKKAAEIIPALFVDMFGDPAKNPNGWETKKISDLVELPIRNGISPSKSGTHLGKVLTLSAITKGYFDLSAVKDASFARALDFNDEVQHNDFLVCRGNGNKDLVGRGCFPSMDMPGVVFPDTAIALKISAQICLREYFETLWGMSYIRRQIDAISKTTNGTYKINQNGLGNVEVRVPPLDKQKVFSEKITRIKAIQFQQNAASLKAEATFNSLLAGFFQ